MRTSIRSIAWGLLLIPVAAGAQLQVRVAHLEPLQPETRCAQERGGPSPMWQALFETVTLDPDVAKQRLVALQDSLTVLAAERPEDVELQFFLAAVLGARSELEGGRTKMRVVQTLLDQLDDVLALDPHHPGSLHMLGRLNASVMRMDWVTRFLATRILGRAKLGAASWDEAERLLEAAASSEPCVGDHYFHLARVYADRGKRALARERLIEMLDLGPAGARDHRVWDQALGLLDELGPE